MADKPDNNGYSEGPGGDVERTGEYVLGLMRGAERDAFESELMQNPALAALVDEWQERFVALSDVLPEETPPRAVWEAIRAEIEKDSKSATPTARIWNSLGFWRGLGAAATAALIALAVWTGYQTPGPAPTGVEVGKASHLAVLGDENRVAYVLVAVDAKAGSASIYPLRELGEPAGKSHELWIVPEGGKPVSLGVFPPSGRHNVNIAAHRAQLAKATLAVSVEPAGGSPTGSPTGPVVWSGKAAGSP